MSDFPLECSSLKHIPSCDWLKHKSRTPWRFFTPHLPLTYPSCSCSRAFSPMKGWDLHSPTKFIPLTLEARIMNCSKSSCTWCWACFATPSLDSNKYTSRWKLKVRYRIRTSFSLDKMDMSSLILDLLLGHTVPRLLLSRFKLFGIFWNIIREWTRKPKSIWSNMKMEVWYQFMILLTISSNDCLLSTN